MIMYMTLEFNIRQQKVVFCNTIWCTISNTTFNVWCQNHKPIPIAKYYFLLSYKFQYFSYIVAVSFNIGVGNRSILQ
jgi:hypothetical protein